MPNIAAIPGILCEWAGQEKEIKWFEFNPGGLADN